MDGWRHVYSGKVRELYERDIDPTTLLIVASDRISAYDHVLPTPIPDKGRILTALTLWWFERLDGLLPNQLSPGDVPPQVAGRAMLCRRLRMFPVECVARGYLAGSGLADYAATGAVCGNPLPAGLRDGDRLPEPIFTPATKAALGEHDENITLDQLAAQLGAKDAERLREATLTLYVQAHRVAADAGIVLADTKLEFGLDPADPDAGLVLADEVLTPDSSRFWPAERWSPGGPQPSFDKQLVRDWLTSPASGWDRAAGTAPPPLPAEVVERTRERYVEAYRRLTGRGWP